MTAFEFAENAEALADAMRDAYKHHEGEAATPDMHPTTLPFCTFERQIAFGQRFLQIVESAQKDRIFEADKLKYQRLESRYAGEHVNGGVKSGHTAAQK